MSTYTVTLSGPAPWGFRLQGGKDFNMPLTISRITPGSKAAGGSLTQGDIISSIDGISTDGMTHLEAQNKIKIATNKLVLTMHKSRRPNLSTGIPRMESPMSVIPHQKEGEVNVDKEEEMEAPVKFGIRLAKKPSKTNLLPEESVHRFPPAPKPPAVSPPAVSPPAVSPPAVSAPGQWGQYNSPAGLYSAQTLREMALLQGMLGEGAAASGLSFLSGSLPVKECVVDSASPVYQAVLQPNERNQDMSEWTHRAANLQSKSFRILAHITGTEYLQDPDEEALQRSREKFESEVKGPRFAKLKNWHHGLSAQILNIQE
ncbi:LIM domain-binding protein 3b isoform X4 [Osmerus eperlanus]|uniref:LIM domain-binding protein 3b isoform X4 n=1 Tax=Osmerus eperlanus TaxID=29151 RepID=UPI002E0DF28E